MIQFFDRAFGSVRPIKNKLTRKINGTSHIREITLD